MPAPYPWFAAPGVLPHTPTPSLPLLVCLSGRAPPLGRAWRDRPLSVRVVVGDASY